MTIELRLFAAARQKAGSETVVLDLPAGARVRDLRRALEEQVPALAGLAPSLLIAVNAEYALDDAEVPAGAEVAAIPPVSGGGFFRDSSS